MSKTVRNIFKTISILILIGITIFIWHNSTEVADVSGEKSTAIVNAVNNTFFHGVQVVTEFIVRKSAHFSEFFLEGAAIALVIASFIEKISKRHWILGFVFGVVIASCDEIIQLFFDGRAGKIFDVCIDSFGVLLGLLLSYAVYTHFYRRSSCK